MSLDFDTNEARDVLERERRTIAERVQARIDFSSPGGALARLQAKYLQRNLVVGWLVAVGLCSLPAFNLGNFRPLTILLVWSAIVVAYVVVCEIVGHILSLFVSTGKHMSVCAALGGVLGALIVLDKKSDQFIFIPLTGMAIGWFAGVVVAGIEENKPVVAAIVGLILVTLFGAAVNKGL